jgi:hypothetical protein
MSCFISSLMLGPSHIYGSEYGTLDLSILYSIPSPELESPTDVQMTDGMQESYVPDATGSESGPGWWTNCEEVFRMEG